MHRKREGSTLSGQCTTKNKAVNHKKEDNICPSNAVHERQYNVLTSGSAKKSLSKHINMGSTFVGLNATNLFPKTDHDLETLFKRYYIYCHRIEKAKGKG